MSTTARTAPQLAGYSYLQPLGSGGFAEVYLYEQQRTGLKVAVKVLNADSLDEAVQRTFTAEANTMARLSGHPFIVPVMDADITADGQPYIVMKYYPKPNLSVRARRAQFSVPDVLRIGIQVSSAVETAHRAGILHRDIKPANILTSEYDEPGLTDFGIAVATTAEATSTAEGMSVPWSPPEVLFGLSDGDVRSDVYALGATLWHLLSGRSPYELAGGDNGHLALMRRIQGERLPTLRRDDVPEALQRLLRRSLDKSPDVRPQTALTLARGLQAVEQDLRLATTTIVVKDKAPAPPVSEDGEDDTPATVVRAARVVPAQPLPRADPAPAVPIEDAPTTGRARAIRTPDALRPGPPAPAPAPAPVTGGPRERMPAPSQPAPEQTMLRARPAPSQPPPGGVPPELPPTGSRRRTALVASTLAVLLVGAAAVAVLLSRGGSAPEAQDSGPQAAEAQDAVDPGRALAPGTPKLTVAAAGGLARFAIAYDDPRPGDTFRWARSGPGAPTGGTLTEPGLELPGPVCITVRAVRSSGLASPSSVPVCAP